MSPIIEDPKNDPDRSCWLLLNNIKELLNITYEFPDATPYTEFWDEVKKKLSLLQYPKEVYIDSQNRSKHKNLINKWKDKFNEWKKKIQEDSQGLSEKYQEWLIRVQEFKYSLYGHNLEALDLIFFIDMFNLNINEIWNDDDQKRVENITKEIKKIAMTRSWEMLQRRRDVINELKYCEVGAFSKGSATLQLQSARLVRSLNSTFNYLPMIKLKDLTAQLSVNVPPVNISVSLRFEID
ncbi:MAG: hypothetical protein ACTSO9_04490 [Candidatus Helarchaeota archaeon]